MKLVYSCRIQLQSWWLILVLCLGTALSACSGILGTQELAVQQEQEIVSGLFRPGNEPHSLPELSSHSPLQDFMLFAMLNQPQVEAAYFDWLTAVQRVTVARSLPNPRLTFSADISSMVTALMPGLIMDFPGPGKLGLRADIASAEADRHYYQFAALVLQAAFAVKREYYSLNFLTDKIQVSQEMLSLVGELEELARTQYQVDRVTFQDVLRAQIEQDRLITDIENLEDLRLPLLTRWKAALGLHADQADPPFPATFTASSFELDPDELHAVALARNPRLQASAAAIRQAEAAWRLALLSRVPNFTAGLGVNVEASPLMWRPQAGISLPIWRDQIAAEIEAAQDQKLSAQARLSADEIALAVSFAERLFALRESERNLDLLQQRLLPKALESLTVARSGYLSAKVNFFNLIDAERTLLDFRLTEIDARTRREIVMAELAFIFMGVPPVSAPLLTIDGNATP
ncbi:MAG: TolC family protein [Pseudomonadales bacterium]|nr:TolC family protein [Pseudomonadales bacterium]